MADSKCELCGEPLPEGEQMFKFHGYSGPCPKPPLPRPAPSPNVFATTHLIDDITAKIIRSGVAASADLKVIKAAVADVLGSTGVWTKGKTEQSGKPVYEVIPSAMSRGYGPRCEIDQVNLPHTVVRNDGSLIASFHSEWYAQKFTEAQNADASKQTGAAA